MNNEDFIRFASPSVKEGAKKAGESVKGAGRKIKRALGKECHAKKEWRYFQETCENYNDQFVGLSDKDARTEAKMKAGNECLNFGISVEPENGEPFFISPCKWSTKR